MSHNGKDSIVCLCFRGILHKIIQFELQRIFLLFFRDVKTGCSRCYFLQSWRSDESPRLLVGSKLYKNGFCCLYLTQSLRRNHSPKNSKLGQKTDPSTETRQKGEKSAPRRRNLQHNTYIVPMPREKDLRFVLTIQKRSKVETIFQK